MATELTDDESPDVHSESTLCVPQVSIMRRPWRQELVLEEIHPATQAYCGGLYLSRRDFAPSNRDAGLIEWLHQLSIIPINDGTLEPLVPVPPELQLFIEFLVALSTALWLRLYLFGDGTGSSSKKYLLAHDGWSEIWEIVLLKSGDVERNPGPPTLTKEELSQVSTEVVEKDDFPEVYKAVFPDSSKWLIICCCLGLGPSLLDTIEENRRGNVEQCLYDSLKHWIQRDYNTHKHGLPTWRQLVEAVDSGGNPALALKIATKHKKFDPLQATKECTEPSVLVSSQVAIALVDKSHKACQTSEDSDLVRSRQMCSDFNKMYRSIVSQLRVKVKNVKDFLRYLHNPQCRAKLCVPPNVYESITTTKDLLSRLSPEYVKPDNIFVLEEIVSEFGSPRCKKVLKDYIDEYL